MDDDQAPICIPFPLLSCCRIQSSAGWYWWEQGGGRGAGCCLWLITAHWQPMVAVGRMQLLASSQQEAGNVSHLPGLQDHTAVPATFLLCWEQG